MPARPSFGRREFLRAGVAAFAAGILSACSRLLPVDLTVRQASPTPPAATTAAPVRAPTVTTPAPTATPVLYVPVVPNEQFYNLPVPDAPQTPAGWTLAVKGLVDRPLTLSLDALRAFPAVTEMRTFGCIENPAGGHLISNAMWKGLRLRDVLAEAGVAANAHYLEFDTLDGLSTGIPLEVALDEHSLLVYEMNGVPLPHAHGAPLRGLWPGRYGMKMPRYLASITLVEKVYRGYWEMQGWSTECRVLPFSRIDYPPDGAQIDSKEFSLSGIAFTDEVGLAMVEVAWDEMDEWHLAELARGPSPLVWTAWRWSGPRLATGIHKVYVRATDNHGHTQRLGPRSNYLGGVFPNGTDAMHWIALEFV